MLRPSARIAKAVAFAAASISPSLPSISGKAIAAASMMPIRRPTITLARPSPSATCAPSHASPHDGASPLDCSGVVAMTCRQDLLGAARPKSPVGRNTSTRTRIEKMITSVQRTCEVLAAERFDEADHHAAEHGARDVADAAEHRGGEGPQARRVADQVARIVVIEPEDQTGRSSQRRARGRR